MLYLILLSLPAGYGVWWLMQRGRVYFRQKKRAALLATPLPEAWRRYLQHSFPLYQRLPPALQRKLEGHIQVFLQEKVFVGCNDMAVSDEVRLLIAAQACMLILNRPTDYYPGFETILVYPDTFVVPVTQRDGALQSHSVSARSGESWHRGPVVLAWDQVLEGAQDGRDGHNVVMHEFAHKLDEENWYMDGLPVLANGEQYADWKRVLTETYEALQQSVEQEQADVIDEYGATSPAEFFAVVTETFFEKPRQLQHHYPALYRQLQSFYHLDPCQWSTESRREQ